MALFSINHQRLLRTQYICTCILFLWWLHRPAEAIVVSANKSCLRDGVSPGKKRVSEESLAWAESTTMEVTERLFDGRVCICYIGLADWVHRRSSEPVGTSFWCCNALRQAFFLLPLPEPIALHHQTRSIYVFSPIELLHCRWTTQLGQYFVAHAKLRELLRRSVTKDLQAWQFSGREKYDKGKKIPIIQ